MFNVPKNKESPLKTEYDALDLSNPTWRASDFQSHAKELFNDEGVKHTASLLVQDMQWRADHLSFFTASISGPQRTGKSQTFIYFSKLSGNIFGVPFKPEHIFWDPFTLMHDIETCPPRSTRMRDEDKRLRAGIMSGYVEDVIATYQDQLGKKQVNLLFAAVRESSGSDLFRFLTKSTEYGSDGLPTFFNVVLLTPHYDNPSLFVWRGYLRVPAPLTNDPEFMLQYEKRKDEYLENLTSRKGDAFADIEDMAQRVIAKKANLLIRKTPMGLVLPANNHLVFNAAKEVVGTFRWTKQGTDIFVQRIKQIISKEYEEHNAKIIVENDLKKKEEQQAKDKRAMEIQEKAKERMVLRIEAQKLALEAEKEKQKLEAKRMELLERKIKLDEEKKIARDLERQKEKENADDFAGTKKVVSGA